MQSLRRLKCNLVQINKQFTRTLNNVVEKTSQEKIKSWREIPGPSSLPIIGQMHHFLPGGWLIRSYFRLSAFEITVSDRYSTVFIGLLSNTDELLTDALYREFGPIVRLDGKFGALPIILLYDGDAIAQVLRTENWLPVRPGFQSLEYYRKNILKRESQDTPTGLITDQGNVWKKFRSMVNPVMLEPKTVSLYRGILNKVAEDMVKRMRLTRNEKNMLNGNFDMEMNLWALESIGVVALGGRLNCLDSDLPDDSPAKKLIQLVHDIFISADELDFKPSLWRYISTPTFKRAMKYYDEQLKISKFFIEEAIKELKTKQTSSDEEKGVLEKLLEIDENVAIIMATDMLFAGVDTVANTMTATLYYLAKNQEKQNKLREEIRLKTEKQYYLKACLKESMRIMPVVAGNMRLTTKEYNLLGYNIPTNMYVTFVHQALSTMEKQFHRSKEFIPERWIVEKSDPLYHGKAHPFAYSPFGFGVRSCIGRRIAELEMETFLAKVIENFQVEWFGPSLKTRPSSLNYIIGPFNFIFKDVL